MDLLFRYIAGWLGRFAAVLCLLGAGTGLAQPMPKIISISPQWIQRGLTNQVVLEGENLSPISRFIFPSDNEMSASIYLPEPGVGLETSQPRIFAAITNSDKRVVLHFVVSADAIPGPRQMRVVTPEGVSNPIKFNISDIPEVAEVSDNHSLEKGQAVALPAGISGKIGAGGEKDYFRFTARKGQRLIFDVDANRSGSPLDSSLALLDAKGKELARNEDANGLDSLIDFAVPAEGEYVLQLRDFRYRGGPEYTYHIRAGALPYLDSIFPFGGQRGQPVDVKLHGRNLDESAAVHLQLDAAAPLGSIDLRGHTGLGFSNPRPFAVGRLPEVSEQEPNDRGETATAVTPPVTINGRIQKEKDVDFFKFKAGKGERFIFEVFAGSFGSPLDAVLALRGTNNAVIEQNNGSGGANSRIDRTFDQAGEFLVSVRDLLDRGGENFGYRLMIAPPPKASFNARLASDAPRVGRGSRTLVRVEAERSGFGGPIQIAGEDLPRGVSCEPLLVPGDLPGGWLEISAADDAELGSFPIKLEATAEMGGKIVAETVEASAGGEGSVANARGRRANRKPRTQPSAGGQDSVAGPFLTVLDRPPFTVDWVTLAASLRQDAATTLRGEVQRSDGFKGEITVAVEGFSASSEDAITRSLEINSAKVQGDALEFFIPAKAKLTSEIGTRPIMLKAEAKVDGASVVQFSKAIPLTILEFPFVLSSSLPRLSLTVLRPGVKSEAGEAEFSVRVERRGWFTDAVALSLDGLPEGIVATSTNLPVNVGEALIRLTTNEKAKPGTNTFTVVGEAGVNGNAFKQRGPSVVLTVNPASDSAETAKQ